MSWGRTCQSCGHIQADKEPKVYGQMTEAYRNRTCRKCGSEDFDYGSNGFVKLPSGRMIYMPQQKEEE